jgi:F0F1-type ATP synthase membrane subunit a
MMGLGIFGAFLQTFVFIMLTMVYIGGAVATEEH